MFNDFLDNVYGEVEVAGMTFNTSRALDQLDPIAWRQRFLNWLDSSELTFTCEECGGTFDVDKDDIDEEDFMPEYCPDCEDKGKE